MKTIVMLTKKEVRLLCMAVLMLFMVVIAHGGEVITDDGTARLRAPINSAQEMGYEFTVGSTPLSVSALGIWDDAASDVASMADGATGGTPDGLVGDVTIRLWESTSPTTGFKLAQTTIAAGTDPNSYLVGEFRYKALDVPIELKANATYQLAVLWTSSADLFHHFQLADATIDFTLSSYIVGFSARYTNINDTFLYLWGGGNVGVATGKAFIGPNLQYDFRVPSSPSPDGSERVDPDGVTLSWTTGQDPNNVGTAYSQIRKHYLYGTFNNEPDDPNLVYIGEIDAGNPTELTASYGPLTLERDRTYYWQIVEGLDNGAGGVYPPEDLNNITGPIWSFDTLLSTPEIDENTPADTHAAVGANAQFNVVAINPFTGNSDHLTYQWYTDPNGIVPLQNGDDYSNVNTDTLTVLNSEISDAGHYYCIVTNTQNSTVSESRHAYLHIDRLIGHWPLDGDLLDYNPYDEKHDGSLQGAEYDNDAIAGQQSLKLSNDDTVPISNSTEFFNIHPFGYTISCWVKTAQTATSNWIIRKRDASTGFGLDRTSLGRVRNYLANGYQFAEDDFVSDNQWHLLTGTYNAETQTLRLFIDGEAKEEALEVAPGATNAAELILGGFTGSLDDVRIYNYALSLEEVASLYLDLVENGEVCTSALETILGDLNGDCKVDILDFSILAGNWLECDLRPVSLCE